MAAHLRFSYRALPKLRRKIGVFIVFSLRDCCDRFGAICFFCEIRVDFYGGAFFWCDQVPFGAATRFLMGRILGSLCMVPVDFVCCRDCRSAIRPDTFDSWVDFPGETRLTRFWLHDEGFREREAKVQLCSLRKSGIGKSCMTLVGLISTVCRNCSMNGGIFGYEKGNPGSE